MYNFRLKNVKKAHQYEELIKAFLKQDEFLIILDQRDENASNTISLSEYEVANSKNDQDDSTNPKNKQKRKYFELVYDGDKNKLKREIFDILKNELSMDLPWGIITGIRPVKLFGEIVTSNNADIEDSIKAAADIFQNEYYVSKEKTRLVVDIYKRQIENVGAPSKNSIGLYIGIPFCPTRCLYCSFTSNVARREEIQRYLEALFKEIEAVAEEINKKRLQIESIYIGGGTPTTLDENQLKELLLKINESFDLEGVREFTLEAGRPDTITEKKLKVAKSFGVDRISINPQTMNDVTLELIGRKHTSEQIIQSLKAAKKIGFSHINMDIITGLPKESLDDFKLTIDKMLELEPTNITVHTLALKKKSKLAKEDDEYNYKHAKIAEAMTEYAYSMLKKAGYFPYYLYRQKNMTGNGENVGFCKDKAESIYNIRIMDEHQSILALGAGGVSKRYFPQENRLKRVPNVLNYEIYIDRIEEMIIRKQNSFF